MYEEAEGNITNLTKEKEEISVQLKETASELEEAKGNITNLTKEKEEISVELKETASD